MAGDYRKATLPTVVGTLALVVVRALEARGFDGQELVRRVGIDLSTLGDVNTRYPITVMNRLLRLAVEVTGDPCFGLWASRFVNPTTFYAMGYAILASSTIRDALERTKRYARFVSAAAQVQISRRGPYLEFALVPENAEARPCHEALDAMLATDARTVRMLSNNTIHPVAVRLERPEPSPSEPFRKVFRSPVAFGQRDNVLRYIASDLDTPLASANPELARWNDVVMTRYLDAMEACVARRLSNWLVNALPAGEPGEATAARALGMSRRNLQRRLQAEGTTYRDVLSDLRREMACTYLDEGRASVTEIAFLLGFTDTCSFSRAFRRWAGLSPREYSRQRAQAVAV